MAKHGPLIPKRPISGWGYNRYGPNYHAWLRIQPDLPEDIAVWERMLEVRVAFGAERFEWVMPHNTVLQVRVEFGLVGLIAFGGLILRMLRDLGQVLRHGDPSQRLPADCVIGATPGFHVCALLGHLALAKIVWMLAGYAAALRRVAFAPWEAAARQPGGAA